MKLAEYRNLRALSRKAAAKELGVSEVSYWRWESGKVTPSSEWQKKIAAWSDGAVMPNDLVVVSV